MLACKFFLLRSAGGVGGPCRNSDDDWVSIEGRICGLTQLPSIATSDSLLGGCCGVTGMFMING